MTNAPKFEVGDRVMRINDSFLEAQEGQFYTVTSSDFGSLGIDADPNYAGYEPKNFVLVPPLEDELRKNYPKVYDDLVATGKFDLAPRDDVFTVTVATRASNHETEETVLDFLTAVAGAGSGMRFSDVKRVS